MGRIMRVRGVACGWGGERDVGESGFGEGDEREWEERELGVGDDGDGTGAGERREERWRIREGGACRVVSDGRKYSGVGVRGRGMLRLLRILRFEFEFELEYGGEEVLFLFRGDKSIDTLEPNVGVAINPTALSSPSRSTHKGNSSLTRSTCPPSHSNNFSLSSCDRVWFKSMR
jgi:hypothetical protein